MGRPVGIDLGTTRSAVACVDENGRPRILADDSGISLVPSVVFEVVMPDMDPAELYSRRVK